MRRVFPGVLLCALIAIAARPVHAQRVVVLGTEDAVTGFTGVIRLSDPPLGVASDGEAAFHPFGINDVDVSDAVQLNDNWVQDPGSVWTQLTDANGNLVPTWYLPADMRGIGCGSENEPKCEPVGHWLFPGAFWIPATPQLQLIIDPDGSVGDFLRVYNDARGANITFHSDVPEPGTFMFLGAGLLAVAGRLRLRRRA